MAILIRSSLLLAIAAASSLALAAQREDHKGRDPVTGPEIRAENLRLYGTYRELLPAERADLPPALVDAPWRLKVQAGAGSDRIARLTGFGGWAHGYLGYSVNQSVPGGVRIAASAPPSADGAETEKPSTAGDGLKPHQILIAGDATKGGLRFYVHHHLRDLAPNLLETSEKLREGRTYVSYSFDQGTARGVARALEDHGEGALKGELAGGVVRFKLGAEPRETDGAGKSSLSAPSEFSRRVEVTVGGVVVRFEHSVKDSDELGKKDGFRFAALKDKSRDGRPVVAMQGIRGKAGKLVVSAKHPALGDAAPHLAEYFFEDKVAGPRLVALALEQLGEGTLLQVDKKGIAYFAVGRPADTKTKN